MEKKSQFYFAKRRKEGKRRTGVVVLEDEPLDHPLAPLPPPPLALQPSVPNQTQHPHLVPLPGPRTVLEDARDPLSTELSMRHRRALRVSLVLRVSDEATRRFRDSRTTAREVEVRGRGGGGGHERRPDRGGRDGSRRGCGDGEKEFGLERRGFETGGEGELLDVGSDAAARKGARGGRTVEEARKGVGERGVKRKVEDGVVRVSSSRFVRRRRSKADYRSMRFVRRRRDESPCLARVPPQFAHCCLFLPIARHSRRPQRRLPCPVEDDDDGEKLYCGGLATPVAVRGGFAVVEGVRKERLTGRSPIKLWGGVGGMFTRYEVSNYAHWRVEGGRSGRGRVVR